MNRQPGSEEEPKAQWAGGKQQLELLPARRLTGARTRYIGGGTGRGFRRYTKTPRFVDPQGGSF